MTSDECRVIERQRPQADNTSLPELIRLNFSGQNDVSVTLSEQYRHQVFILRKRQKRTAWIPWLFALGLCFSIIGIVPSVASFRDEGSPWGKVIFLAFGVLYF